jgi:hypothetical protein
MFEDEEENLPLTRQHFDSDVILEAFLRKRALRNVQLGVFFETDHGSDDDGDEGGGEDEGEDRDGVPLIEKKSPVGQKGFAAVTHEITAAGYYAEFLGYSYALSARFVLTLGRITKYLQQADVSIRIQENSETLLFFKGLHTFLCTRQSRIDARISRWLLLGNLAESNTSLVQFGLRELQPFLELCLRYLFLPMETVRLRGMRMVLEQLPADATYLYDLSARAAMYGSTDVKVPVGDLIFLNGDHLAHVSMVYSNNSKSNTHGRLVVRDIEQTLSVYMFFFFKYCKGDWNTQIKRMRQVANTHPFFGQVFGGGWKYLMRDVRDYVTRLGYIK